MKQLLINKGSIKVEDVPAPFVGDRESLIRVHYSCISTGTEIGGIKSSGESLYKNALKKPQNVKKVLEMIRKQGLKKAIVRVKNKIDIAKPIGYSASDIVLEVGKKI